MENLVSHGLSALNGMGQMNLMADAMAATQEVAEVMPEAVVHTPSGYMAVKYGELLKEF